CSREGELQLTPVMRPCWTSGADMYSATLPDARTTTPGTLDGLWTGTVSQDRLELGRYWGAQAVWPFGRATWSSIAEPGGAARSIAGSRARERPPPRSGAASRGASPPQNTRTPASRATSANSPAFDR